MLNFTTDLLFNRLLFSPHQAAEFISIIAQEQRKRLKEIFTTAHCSILTDGSQARKTGSEKELVFIKVLHDGISTFMMAGLQDMDDYGDATASALIALADNLRAAVDDVFLKTLGLSEEQYLCGMVSTAADGAAVNTGIIICYNFLLIHFFFSHNSQPLNSSSGLYNGLLTQLRERDALGLLASIASHTKQSWL